MESPVSHSSGEPQGRRSRRRTLALGVVLGGGLLAVAGGLFLWARDETVPRLTAADFEAAEKRWKERGPENYNLDVEVSGKQTGSYHVEVRGGTVTACTRNGIAPRKGVWETWTVPGQFDTLAREIEAAERPERVFNVAPGARVYQQAAFDPEFGYPRLYERRVLTTDLTIRWQTTRFEVVPSP